MQHIIFSFLFLLSVGETTTQLKIDTGYVFMVNDTAYSIISLREIYSGSASIGVKEIASGKTCAIVSAEWTLMIKGEIFHATNPSNTRKYLDMLKPKDQIFIEKIKLADGCFIPPKQIAITVW